MREWLTYRLAELEVAGPDVCAEKLLRYGAMVLERNRVMNLTGAPDLETLVREHLLDCAAAMSRLRPEGLQVADIGTGAGLPGVPLACLFPSAEILLLDSLNKRIEFLKECIAKIPLEHAQAVHGRAEEFASKHRETFDLVVSRAVARLNLLVELCLPFVKVGGRFAAMKSTHCQEELTQAAHAIALLGGELAAVEDYTIPGSTVSQRLVVIHKVVETPACYPRRFKKIEAKPL